ncbi:hypothetical protein GCM10010260_20550 [Streptomyces filipinensis]|uniref:Uncharacterized protein n=1 Tax=Streptomyces filipinensis TaxID=66887 RepID=A0A918IA56_9ACTN|nr:hypothetical protein GCM10010260_20550 [Streptomyces filipinensis]
MAAAVLAVVAAVGWRPATGLDPARHTQHPHRISNRSAWGTGLALPLALGSPVRARGPFVPRPAVPAPRGLSYDAHLRPEETGQARVLQDSECCLIEIPGGTPDDQSSAGVSRSETELMQYRWSVGVG